MWQGEKGRETLGYMCMSWRELWEGGTDRQMGRVGEKEEEWIEEREKHKELCRETKKQIGLGGSKRRAVKEGKTADLAGLWCGNQWIVCGREKCASQVLHS